VASPIWRRHADSDALVLARLRAVHGDAARRLPTLEGEGVRVELADLHWHPCAARERRVDYLPTITVDADDETELFRCCGYPTDEVVDRIIEAYGGRRAGDRNRPPRPS
jgi:hypothetical protein